MADYWVSHDKYFCKYCKIYIADDKPSRIQHETGLRHKGNYERYIRDIYKKGATDKREKDDAAKEMARIEAAAAASMGLTPSAPSTSAKSASAKGKTAAGKDAKKADVWANYTTAESLGYSEDPQVKREREEAEQRKVEGTIGGWQRVVKPPAATVSDGPGPVASSSSSSSHDTRTTGTNAAVDANPEEEERPSTRRYLSEKSATDAADDGWDPARAGQLKLKRKVLTLAERQELERKQAEEEQERERVKRVKRDQDEQMRGTAARRTGAGFVSGSWQSVDVRDEPVLTFDALAPKTEPGLDERSAVKAEEGAEVKLDPEGSNAPTRTDGGTGTGDQDVKPEVPPTTTASSGFKKRKTHAGGAVRRK